MPAVGSVIVAYSDWGTWNPTLSNLTLGAGGTVTARYRQIGKTVDYRFKFKFGSGSAVGTAPGFTLPVAPHASYVGSEDPIGGAWFLDSGGNVYRAIIRFQGGSTADFFSFGASGVLTTVTATAPFTWGTSDCLSAMGTYEAA